MRTRLLIVLLVSLLPGWAFSQCAPTFFDGFESGSYTPTWSMGAGLTSGAVTTTNPSSGTYRLEGTGGFSTHLTGYSTTVTATQPTEISWDVYLEPGGINKNYFVAGDASVTANNCIVFCYWYNGASLNFVSNTTYVYPVVASTWYHVQLKNINWTNHTFDIWIDNVLRQSTFAFRSASQNSLSKIHLYNFGNGVGVWDNIQIGTSNLPVATTLATNPACNGDLNGAIDLSVTSGTPGYSYLWSNGATTQDLSSVGAGTYTVTVTDIVPCTTTTTVTLIQPAVLTNTQTVTDLSCNGSADGAIDNTTAGGTTSYHYAWSNGDTTQNVSGLAAGAYTVTLTDAHGCTNIDSVTVAEPPAIVIADSILQPICHGDSNGVAIVSPSGGSGSGYTYFWSTGSLTSASGPISAGSYMVMVTDGSGCTEVDSIIVSEPALLAASGVGSNPLCNGDSSGTITLTPTGGTPAYTYLWSDGSTAQNLTGVMAGSYSVTITDANGCITSNAATLIDPAAIVATGVTTDVDGSSLGSIDLTVTGGTGNFSYAWSNGATTQDLNGLGFGTYTVTITDANGCSVVTSFFISITNGIYTAFPLQVSVAPNPFSGEFTVRLGGMGTDAVALALVDLQGRVIWQDLNVHQAQLVLAPTLAQGVYFLKVNVADQSMTLKLMRQ